MEDDYNFRIKDSSSQEADVQNTTHANIVFFFSFCHSNTTIVYLPFLDIVESINHFET